MYNDTDVARSDLSVLVASFRSTSLARVQIVFTNMVVHFIFLLLLQRLWKSWMAGGWSKFIYDALRCLNDTTRSYPAQMDSPQRRDGQEKRSGCNRTDSALAPICSVWHWDQISLLVISALIFFLGLR